MPDTAGSLIEAIGRLQHDLAAYKFWQGGGAHVLAVQAV